MLGAKIKEIRDIGTTKEESDLFEMNLKRLITTWSFEDNFLHEYAARHWSGLMKSFYYERWKIFFDNI